MKKEIRILVADDHIMVRNGLMLMLEHQKSFVANINEVTNGLEVIEAISSPDNEFDIILLDITMPELDGIGVLKKMKTLEIKIPVLILSMHNEESIIKQAIENGANGYILKNSGVEELVKAINTVLKNEMYYSNEIAQILFSDTKKSKETKEKKSLIKFEDNLSKRELQILALLVKEYTNQEIADELLISRRTIEGHRKNMMAKLQIKTTVGLVVYALKNGMK